MADAAVGASDSALTPAQLAARYGLHVAGDRPRLIAYSRNLWAYRHFIMNFANARLAASFNTARLGRMWQVLTPLANAGVYYLIFGVILKTSHGIHNFTAFLCTGIFVFHFTQQAVTGGTTAISGNLGLIRALHFPRASLPLAVTVTKLQELAYSMLVLIAIVLMTGESVTFNWLLIVPILALQTLFNAGLAMVFARAGSRQHDLKQIMPFVLRTWLYASGVFYNMAKIIADPDTPPLVAKLLVLNPMLVYIDLMRYALLGPDPSTPLPASLSTMWLLAVGWAVLIGVAGYVFFWRGEKEYGRG
jgi:teichoic acid transport system permease protein